MDSGRTINKKQVMGIPKEQLRKTIAENDTKKAWDTYALFKESQGHPARTVGGGNGILHRLAKSNKESVDTENKRNDYSLKTVKNRWYGQFQVDVPQDRNGEFEPMILPRRGFKILCVFNNFRQIMQRR